VLPAVDRRVEPPSGSREAPRLERTVGGLSGTLLDRLEEDPGADGPTARDARRPTSHSGSGAAPGRRSGAARAAAAAVLFLLASASFHAVVVPERRPYPTDDVIAVKEQLFLAARDDVDVLFIGTSRVYRGIDASRFDATAAERGLDLRSLNAGVPRLEGFEVEQFLDRLLDTRPRRLDWVVIDPGLLATATRGDNHLTRRFASWHDLPTTWRVLCRIAADEDHSASKKVRYGRKHLTSAFLRYAWVGGLSSRWLARPGPPPRVGRAGFLSLEESARWSAACRERAEHFARTRARYARQIERLAESRREPLPPLTDAERRFLAGLVERIESAGARAIFLTSPRQDDRQAYLARAAAEGLLPVLLDYADPERYPSLYEPALRFDAGHLNAAGAARYTEILARDVLAVIRRVGTD